jgi:hypothetical protein
MSTGLAEPRKSHTDLGKIYFWTATIHKWHGLLRANENKQIILDSLKYLSDKGLITVYAFVIMPTHTIPPHGVISLPVKDSSNLIIVFFYR